MKIPFNDVFLFRNKEYKILFGPPPQKKKRRLQTNINLTIWSHVQHEYCTTTLTEE